METVEVPKPLKGRKRQRHFLMKLEALGAALAIPGVTYGTLKPQAATKQESSDRKSCDELPESVLSNRRSMSPERRCSSCFFCPKSMNQRTSRFTSSPQIKGFRSYILAREAIVADALRLSTWPSVQILKPDNRPSAGNLETYDTGISQRCPCPEPGRTVVPARAAERLRRTPL